MKTKILISTVVCISLLALGVFCYKFLKNETLKTAPQTVTHISKAKKASVPQKKHVNKTDKKKNEILKLAYRAVRDALNGQETPFPKYGEVSKDLMHKKGVFVTIRRGDALIGCVGTTTPEPLARAIIKNARRAILYDRARGHLLAEDVDLDTINITVSVLSPLVEIPFTTREDLVTKLDSSAGLVLKRDRKKAVYLPQIWKLYPSADKFLTSLEKKGRISKEDWDDKIKAYKFMVEEFSEPEKMKKWRDHQIEMGQKVLRNLITENGDVIYGYDFKNSSYVTENISKVRQMGTIMAVAYILYKTNDQTLIPVLRKSFERIEKEHVIEQEDLKVGAKSLLLMATLYYEKATGETLQLREDLVKNVVGAYRPNVGFLVSNSAQETSPFFDGEAWLALSLYNVFYPADTELKELLPSVDATMLNKYSPGDTRNPFFSFGLQAAAIRFEQTNDEKLFDYMKKVSLGLMNENLYSRASSSAVIEGMIAVAGAVRHKDPMLFSMLYDYITVNLRLVSVLQVIDKNHFSEDKKFDEQSKKFEGSFLTIYPEPISRCDSTGHSVLVLMNYSEL